MKKKLILALFLCFYLVGWAQEKKYALYSVAFYNLENLFDTTHDEGKNDYEYLPDGANKWTETKYQAKLKNMSEILSLLATDRLPMGPAIIGVSEIENRRVLEDLLKQPALAERGYEIIHYDGEDKRGVECAFLYNPKFFHVNSTGLLPYVYENDTIHKTRGFLVADGELAGEHFVCIVNHWPSRAAASPARERAGEQVRAIKDSLQRIDPSVKIVIMGDMNDDPMDKSMSVSLGAKRKAKDTGKMDLFNPWWDTLKKGYGTLMYQGKWNLFDQIVFTGNFLNDDYSSLTYYKHEIFRRDFMFQNSGKYKGYPKRTHAGGVWLNGYSDHLPTIVYFLKEVKE
ncbi:endonuclease/exonuclease/phosphatase family protein [Phocaeicola plebeius]|uniref:endonuclease/exonuclease/phosphatase family protein n=1 Tax=Phocaeicola plebeius TaxID=310297 RepID=UPI003FEF5546